MIRRLSTEDIPAVIALQNECFPPPFPGELLWNDDHLRSHLETFSEGQFVALQANTVVASATSVRISEANWQAHRPWELTVGGHHLKSYDPTGSTLYGVDISVHPKYRGVGIGRALYQARFNLVRELKLIRFGTACRMPGRHHYPELSGPEYAFAVVQGTVTDQTLTPLLRYGLALVDVIEEYMEDMESGHAAALLEWRP